MLFRRRMGLLDIHLVLSLESENSVCYPGPVSQYQKYGKLTHQPGYYCLFLFLPYNSEWLS
jgi:hypothetical protein